MGTGFVSTLCGYGFLHKAPRGISIKALLESLPGIDADYLENNIGTILQDGAPVDDIETCKIHEDATLALSGALPGLFGAAFRKQGKFAALRPRGVSESDHPNARKDTVTLTLKLFNLTAREIGPRLLENGVRMPAGTFRAFWKRWLHLEKGGDIYASLNNRPILPQSLAESIDSETVVLFAANS